MHPSDEELYKYNYENLRLEITPTTKIRSVDRRSIRQSLPLSVKEIGDTVDRHVVPEDARERGPRRICGGGGEGGRVGGGGGGGDEDPRRDEEGVRGKVGCYLSHHKAVITFSLPDRSLATLLVSAQVDIGITPTPVTPGNRKATPAPSNMAAHIRDSVHLDVAKGRAKGGLAQGGRERERRVEGGKRKGERSKRR